MSAGPEPPVPANRVALVHDWLTGMRGGEMVLREFCRMFPQADIFTLVYLPGHADPEIESHRIVESSLARLPTGRHHFRPLLPLFPWAVEGFDLKGYDLVLSSSHCVAKGVIPAPDALHVSYVHTPMRYVWDLRGEYLSAARAGWVKRALGGVAAHYLRLWDVASAARVDQFVANSHHVRRRIWKYYHREAKVVYPPVDVGRFRLGEGKGGFFLVVSALVPYKRVDLAVRACSRLGVRLVVAGEGSERRRLASMAGRTVEFVGSQSPERLEELYRHAEALLFPGEEDFGIVPVEAQACGCPVVAYGRGGVVETVRVGGERPTGVFFYEQTPEALERVLVGFDRGRFHAEDARANAERFSRERFVGEMSGLLRDVWETRN